MTDIQLIDYDASYLNSLFDLIHSTIDRVYPIYYPPGVADFFHQHHSLDNLKTDLSLSHTVLAFKDKEIIGTGALAGNEIKRVFVRMDIQGQGIGKAIMQQLENKALKEKQKLLTLSSTLAAYDFYLRLGYIQSEYNIMDVPRNQKLCYFTMVKSLL